MTATLTFKRMTALRKLVTSIILCSPEIEIDAGNQLISHQEPWSRKHTKREYKWISNGMGTTIAVPVSERKPHGLHSDATTSKRSSLDSDRLGRGCYCQQDVAMIEEEIKNRRVDIQTAPAHDALIQKTIDRARTRRLHSKLYQGLGGLIDKLNEVAKTDQWCSHVQYRLPADLWKQRGCLTPYQMWTTYQISTMQLNVPSIRALERLCATLVSNFPQLLYRPQQANVLRLYNGQRHYNHEWHLHTSEATLTHVDTTLVKATHTVHSATDCDVMATRDLNGQKVSFHAHPRFTRIVQLWGGNGRYNTTRSFYRQQVAATRTQIGKDTREMQQSTKLSIQQDLWITVYTAQTLLRLKANRLSMWNYEKADLSCSNPECSQVVQSSVQHLLWECPKAKLVWNYFYALWAKIRITPGHDPAIWIFSLDLPDTPRRAWTTIKRHIIGHKFSNEHLQDHLYSVAHMLWRYMSATLIHAIWCAHLRRMDSDPIESTSEMAIMMTRLEAGMRNLTRLAEAQAGGSDGHTVVAVLKAYVDCFLSQTDAIPLTPSDTRGVYLLFFDGGSRGNPVPGGTGSIIVRVHKDSHTASLIWAASMAYSRKDTTNNFAEYWGLIHGLREAQRSHFESFRRLADCIDIRGWYHHYRDFNKMADSAANLAMDTRTSTQVHFPTQRAAFNNLTQDLDNDVMHWLMRIWSCKRAQAAWTVFLGQWMDRALTEQALNLFLPHIVSRTAPPGQWPLLQELEKHFGFIAPEHSTALQKLWFIATSSIPVLLWRTRVEIAHEQQRVTIEESTKPIDGNSNALKDGLAFSAHYLQHYEVKMEVFGDSQMIVASQNGFSSIRQTKLQPLAARVNQVIANFAWTSWNHAKREQNKMADLLANMAMNSKSAKILTDESRGNDQILMSQVAALLDNDIGVTPSKLRNTSLGHRTGIVDVIGLLTYIRSRLAGITPVVLGQQA
ncbi:reverse transcriptase, partial [Globisporangium splendens]